MGRLDEATGVLVGVAMRRWRSRPAEGRDGTATPREGGSGVERSVLYRATLLMCESGMTLEERVVRGVRCVTTGKTKRRVAVLSSSWRRAFD